MRSDLTDITLVVDRSGSMQARRGRCPGDVMLFLGVDALAGPIYPLTTFPTAIRRTPR